MLRLSTIACGILLLSVALTVRAQDDEVSLGDLARTIRKEKATDAHPQVIDNDNLSVMMDQAEAERLNGKPVFSIDPSGKAFRMTSPDGTCSLSFDAKATALISSPYISSELPQYELARLEGSATIHDGILEVTVHNATGWELKEVVIGVTLLNQTGAELQPASLITTTDLQTEARRPDVTAIYHLKATAPSDSTAVFKGIVSDEVGQAKDWHWALVAARGVPPAPPVSTPVQAITDSVQQSGAPIQPTATATGAPLPPAAASTSSVGGVSIPDSSATQAAIPPAAGTTAIAPSHVPQH